MRGREPTPFDLLYWNADSTRMAAANHSFYLRNCYLENNLSLANMDFDEFADAVDAAGIFRGFE